MNERNRKIAFLILSSTPIGVLESQVINFASYLGKNFNRPISIILIGKRIEIESQDFPMNISVHYLGETLKLSELRNFIIYIRTVDVFWKYWLRLKLQKNLIIYDFRALLFAESFLRNRNYLRTAGIFLSELLCYLTADKICTVSNQLKSKLFIYFYQKRDVFVFPCISFLTHSMVNLNESVDRQKLSFVYLGGMSKWQKFGKAVQVYKKLCTENSLSFSFTVITHQSEIAQNILNTNGVKATIKSLPQSKIGMELTNYDFGFIVRDNILVNNVASPIKFFEYLNSGVMPIISKGVGDFSRDVQVYDIGIVIDEDFNLSIKDLLRLKYDNDRKFRLSQYIAENDIEKRIIGHPILTK